MKALLIAAVLVWVAIPAGAASKTVKPKNAAKPPAPTLAAKTEKQLTAIAVRGCWKHIVIHHTATASATARGIDRFHREKRHMENGMAYHFLIGNGKGMADGEIYVGNRWKKQIQGGHLASEQLNMSSIGICLVGNFDEKGPTAQQMRSLEALLRKLLKQTGLSKSVVTTHRSIHPRHTHCPGKHFSLPQL